MIDTAASITSFSDQAGFRLATFNSGVSDEVLFRAVGRGWRVPEFDPCKHRRARELRLKVEGCDGVSNAWYEDDAVTVCYEYIADFLRNASQQTAPAGVTRADAIVGPTLEVFLHEVGHAVFDYLSVPVLGREEDAADRFAAYILLQFAKSDAKRLMGGVAYSYNIDAAAPSASKNPFADEHGLPVQRFYNVLCMAYGADSKLFADVVENAISAMIELRAATASTSRLLGR